MVRMHRGTIYATYFHLLYKVEKVIRELVNDASHLKNESNENLHKTIIMVNEVSS